MPTSRQEMISKIRERAIEVNPEIVELKMGCRVRRFGDPEMIEILVNIKSHGNGLHTVYLLEQTVGGIVFQPECTTDEIEEWVIIGRPIRLADILLAINETTENVKIDDFGDFFTNDGGADRDSHVHWNLRKDDINDQEDATIEFIYELVK